MTGHADHHCRRLLAALAALDDEDGAKAERLLAAHVAACPECAASERRLDELIAGFERAGVPPLPPEVEARLLDRLCASHADA